VDGEANGSTLKMQVVPAGDSRCARASIPASALWFTCYIDAFAHRIDRGGFYVRALIRVVCFATGEVYEREFFGKSTVALRRNARRFSRAWLGAGLRFHIRIMEVL
jgi:hypothetical protein